MAHRAEPQPTETVHRALPVPTTFGGVAALACRPMQWLGLWQTGVALVSGVVLAWAVEATWGRALLHAARNLPDEAEITSGTLHWKGPSPAILHQGPFLGIVIDPRGRRESALGSDLTLSVEEDRLAFRSILGWFDVAFPVDLRVSLSRNVVLGDLGAWMSPALIGIATAVFLGLLVAWVCLAVIYALVLRLAFGAGGRLPSFGKAWKLCAASLLFPAILVTASVVLYVIREIGLPGLMMAQALHVILGWVYCLGGLARMPRPSANPFEHPPQDDPPAPSLPENPFAS